MNPLTLSRTFNAAPATVFAFVTQMDHLLKWWGPEGMSISDHNLDLSKPGPWGSTMVNKEGGAYKVTGTVLNVDPPHSVEFTWAWHDENDQRGHESVVRFEIKENGEGGTKFLLIHSGLPDEDSKTNHNKGWSSSLIKLEKLATTSS